MDDEVEGARVPKYTATREDIMEEPLRVEEVKGFVRIVGIEGGERRFLIYIMKLPEFYGSCSVPSCRHEQFSEVLEGVEFFMYIRLLIEGIITKPYD